MVPFVVATHVVVCIALILIVLLQAGKGADMGAAFGGSSQTIFGSSGAGGFMEKLTAVAAIIFMLTSLTLSYFSAQQSGSSIMEEVSKPLKENTQSAPASPESK